MISELYPLFAGILSALSFSFIAIHYKKLRMAGVSAAATIAVKGLTVPLWLIGLSFFYDDFIQTLNNDDLYKWLILWAVFCIASTWLRSFLFKYQSLSEAQSLLKGVLFFFLLASDFFFFDEALNPVIIVCACFLVWAGFIFAGERTVASKVFVMSGGYWRVFGLICVMAMIIACQLIFYKKGAVMIETSILYALLASLVINPMNFLLAPREVIGLITKGSAEVKKSVIWICTMLMIGASLEVYAYQNLPLIIVHLTAIIPVMVYAFVDKLNGEIAWTRKSWTAFFGTITALVIIGLEKAGYLHF